MVVATGCASARIVRDRVDTRQRYRWFSLGSAAFSKSTKRLLHHGTRGKASLITNRYGVWKWLNW